MGDHLPRAAVTESGDEVSCSVEETNRIRASLGLRPLDVGPRRASNEVDVRVDASSARETDELKSRIERARREREAAQSAQGRGLGDVLTAEASMSAAQWVAQAKKAQATQMKKQQAAKLSTIDDLEEESYSATGFRAGRGGSGAVELDGLRIGHSADAFAEGQSVILTLKDSALLNEKGTELADTEDELVSSELVAHENAADSNARKAMVTKPVYSGVDYDESVGHGMLSQYDEEANAAARKRAAALVIGAGGTVKPAGDAEAAAERVKVRLAAAAAARSGSAVALGGTTAEEAPKLASDYYSAAEMAAFGASRKGGKGAKKKGLRKAGAGEAEEEAPPAAQAPAPMGGSEVAADAGSDRDRGSRAARRGQAGASRAQTEADTQATQQAAFDNAVAKAGVKAEAAFKSDGAPPKGWKEASDDGAPGAVVPGVVPIALEAPAGPAAGGAINGFSRQRVYSRLRADGPDGDGAAGQDDDDAELNAVLARARRLKQASSAAALASTDGSAAGPEASASHAPDRAAADIVERLAAQERHRTSRALEAGSGMQVEGEAGYSGGGGMVFTETTEFSRLLEGRILTELREQEEELRDEEGAQHEARASSSSLRQPGEPHASPDVGTAPPEGATAGRKRRRWEDAEGSASASAGADGGEASTAAAASSWTSVEGAEGAAAGGSGEGDHDDGDDDDDDDEGSDGDDGYRSADDSAAADSFTGREPNVSRGVAGALALFARTGALNAKEDNYRGRTKDERPGWDQSKAGSSAAGGGKDVKLEYRDKYGNKLTPKEAYRELCYKFHGREPSQKVRDKRLRKMRREQALERVSSTDTPLGSLQALQRAQESRGAAYISIGK